MNDGKKGNSGKAELISQMSKEVRSDKMFDASIMSGLMIHEKACEGSEWMDWVMEKAMLIRV